MKKTDSPQTRIKRVLVANRGEIVLRVARTCKQLGIESVSVYGEGEENHPHTLATDKAVALNRGRGSQAYLDGSRIIEIAKATGSDAIHPGYGFLAENPEFVRAVTKSGLIFIGPPAKAMEALGHKHSAREVAVKAGVNVAPGYHGDDQSLARLLKEAKAIGFPLLIKASAGGGGKGMRRVLDAAELEAALLGAQREARNFFSDERLLLEKIITPARHIEIQLIADTHGNVLHLFERDCSVQRRHQKVFEESPAPALDAKLREKLFEAAVTLGKTVGLVGAATAEFLVPHNKSGGNTTGGFYFLEVNPRLQVEHPVTEMVTGLDLVELQLRAAAGLPLGIKQEEIKLRGAAIEARIYAEIPLLGFTPNIGQVVGLHLPDLQADHTLRFDHALIPGISVTTDFDPMLGKLIAWGENRENAMRRLAQGLKETGVAGVWTNNLFLINVLEKSEFARGPVSTDFLEVHPELASTFDTAAVIPQVMASYLVARLISRAKRWPGVSTSNDPFDHYDYWRGAGSQVFEPPIIYQLKSGDLAEPIEVSARTTARKENTGQFPSLQIEVDAQKYTLSLPDNSAPNSIPTTIELNGKPFSPQIFPVGKSEFFSTYVGIAGYSFLVSRSNPWPTLVAKLSDSKTIHSPLPGSVLSVKVREGQSVNPGDPLVVIESMKMEHSLNAPFAAKVKEVFTEPGRAVKQGEVLLVFE